MKRWIASLLSASLVLASPGLAAYSHASGSHQAQGASRSSLPSTPVVAKIALAPLASGAMGIGISELSTFKTPTTLSASAAPSNPAAALARLNAANASFPARPLSRAAPQRSSLNALSNAQGDIARIEATGSNLGQLQSRIGAVYTKLAAGPSDDAQPPKSSAELARPSGLKRGPGRIGRGFSRAFDAVVARIPPLRKINQEEPGVLPLVALSFVWGALTMAAYSAVISQVQRTFLSSAFPNAVAVPWTYIFSPVATGLAVIVFNRFTKFSREKLITGTFLALGVMLAGFWLGFRLDEHVLPNGQPAATSGWLAFPFSLWSDIFGAVAVTTFWTYLNDIFKTGSAKRFFGFIAAGAPLGAIIGSWFFKTYVTSVGNVNMLLAALAAFLLTIPVFRLMESLTRSRPAIVDEKAAEPPAKASAKTVVAMIISSSFLLLFALNVFFERMVPDFANYIFEALLADKFGNNRGAMSAFRGEFNFWVNIGSLAATVMMAFGLNKLLKQRGALLTAPVSNLIGLIMFFAFPFLPMTLGHNAIDGVSRYTTFKWGKETKSKEIDKAVLYQVKAFIEWFIYRVARGLAGGIVILLKAQEAGPKTASLIGIPFAVLWFVIAYKLGGKTGPAAAAPAAPKKNG